jgi:hypothetical protein
MSERTVDVWGKPQTVEVFQKSKSVWVASGSYLGQPVEVQDRSAGAALKRWQEAARYRGN